MAEGKEGMPVNQRVVEYKHDKLPVGIKLEIDEEYMDKLTPIEYEMVKDLTAGFAHTIAGFAEGKDDLKMVGIDTIDALGLLAHSLLETQTGLKGIIDEGRAKKN